MTSRSSVIPAENSLDNVIYPAKMSSWHQNYLQGLITVVQAFSSWITNLFDVILIKPVKKVSST